MGKGFAVSVTLDRSVAPQGSVAPVPGSASSVPRAGRLLVFVSSRAPEGDGRFLGPDFFAPRRTFIAAIGVGGLRAGETVTLGADADAFPAPLHEVPAGDEWLQAVLDVHRTYAYGGLEDGDLYSRVVERRLTAGGEEHVLLRLTQRYDDPPRPDTAHVMAVRFVSPSLSAFAGHPVTMRAGVILPPGYRSDPRRRYPTVYLLPAFGGDYRKAWTAARTGIEGEPEGIEALEAQTGEPMIVVVLDISGPLGAQEFADSANNGPWGHALVTEFIPYVERRFRMESRASARLLTGHSSGGWAALWLQVNYPRVFGGAWATAPDPVDFRDFLGADLTRKVPGNMYVTRGGAVRNLWRAGRRDLVSIRDFVHEEDVLGEPASQFGSFDAVFSPRGRDGRPERLFDHRSGAIDPVVARYWEEHDDISALLARRWRALGPAVRGRLHVVVGAEDSFHLDGPVRLMAARLRGLGADAEIEVVPGGTHFNLYRKGLFARFWREMYATACPGTVSVRRAEAARGGSD